MTWRRRTLRVVVRVWILASHAHAVAQPPAGEPAPATRDDVAFAWVRTAGAEACPSAGLLRGGVIDLLDADPFGPAPSLFIEGLVTRLSPGWSAVLFFRGEDGAAIGSRDIRSDGDDCESLARAVVVAVAIAIDPSAGIRADAADVRLQTDRDGVSERVEPGEDETGRGPVVALGPAWALGFVPDDPAPGVGLAARARTHDGLWSFGLGALFVPWRAASGGLDVSLAALQAEGCAVWAPLAWLEVRGCVRVLGGAHLTYADARGGAPSSRATFFWAAAGVAGEVSVNLVGPLQLTIEAAPAVSLSRRAYRDVNAADPLFEEAPVGFVGMAAVAVEL